MYNQPGRKFKIDLMEGCRLKKKSEVIKWKSIDRFKFVITKTSESKEFMDWLHARLTSWFVSSNPAKKLDQS